MTITSLPWSLRALILVATAAADSFPYNPTRVLSTTNSTFAYILQPSTQSPNLGVLKAVNVGNGFTTGQLSPITITDNLPFLQDDMLVPYTPIVDGSRNITVVAGQCTAGAESTQLWRFTPGSSEDIGSSGSWKQYRTMEQDLTPGSNLTGSNYLANGIAFATAVDNEESELGFYLFGGMCPFSATDADTWVSHSAYSNNMLQLVPAQSGSGDVVYDIQSIATRGPAIAEAGFSLTGMTPTFSMDPDGKVHSQQQDFVLLGGHTQEAFINMSNIALFSLPQQSWTFVPVQQPSSVKTDLAARQNEVIVEPRSGHTAVLSEDGGSVIVFGGWVGDVSNPAQPQLAVLHLGSEYGGNASEEWTWTVPTSADILPFSGGLYGHGATMLPGGVMMIVGGYSISSNSSNKAKRDMQTTNDGVFLYNTTSNSWETSYAPPAMFSLAADSHSGGSLSKTSQQAGLGAGLGIGALVFAGVCCFYVWYSRRLKKRRKEREDSLLADPSQISFMQIDQSYMDRPGIDGRGGDMFAGQQHSEMTQAGSTGLWTNVPSPTRGLRSGLAKRPYMYHAAPRYDERRLNQGSGNIHPILESEDEHSLRGDDEEAVESSAVQKLRQMVRIFDNGQKESEQSLSELQRVLHSRASSPVKDPFADPEPNPLGSHPIHPPFPETVRRVHTNASRMGLHTSRRPLSQELEGSANWLLVDGTDELLDHSSSSNGRSSPSRTDDRTSSTLSEASQRSHKSSTSITRTMSTRTGALLAATFALRRDADNQKNRAESAAQASAAGRAFPHNFENPYGTTQNLPFERSSMYAAQKSAESFATARTSFAALQDQGQALLGGRPMADRDDPYQRAIAATNPQVEHPSSQTANARTSASSPRRGKGWVGSLRRAITAMSNSDRSLSFTGSAADRHEDGTRTSSSSPTRAQRPTSKPGPPRRAASDGGALLRQKRGETDWEKDKDFIPYHDDPDPGDWGERRTSIEDRAAENEWDVEGAVSKRDVQVMFTVPKARLRVVNADVDRASMRSVSDSAMSRSESMRNLKRAESVNTVRSRSDGERTAEKSLFVPTAEEKGQAQSTAREL